MCLAFDVETEPAGFRDIGEPNRSSFPYFNSLSATLIANERSRSPKKCSAEVPTAV
jgi:hypothetical protein